MRKTFSVLLLALFALSACEDSRKKLVGKWKVESTDTVWEFSPNGTLTTNETPGRYTFGDNNRIKIQTGPATFVYQLEFQGEHMIWRDPNGSTMELSKIK